VKLGFSCQAKKFTFQGGKILYVAHVLSYLFMDSRIASSKVNSTSKKSCELGGLMVEMGEVNGTYSIS
jgi:hypothetical protein